MKRLALFTLLFAACGGDDNDFPTNSCADQQGTCVEVAGGDAAKLQETVNTIGGSTTIVLGKGVFKMSNSLTIRTDGVKLIGQGIDETTLDYAEATAQVN